jgi:hypothetical protein
MDLQIGTKFKMPPSYINKHVYEVIGETENEAFLDSKKYLISRV